MMAGNKHIQLSIGSVPYDNSGLRDRLGGYVAKPRSIEAELRALMAERENATETKKRRKSRWD